VDHSADLHEEVQDAILDFSGGEWPRPFRAKPFLSSRQAFFSEAFPEDSRLRVLFGPPHDRAGRTARRSGLVAHLYARGYEPVPATMAPPYRGLEVDPETTYTDSQGNSWQDYRITHPQAMSRVFGPLARYNLNFDRLPPVAREAATEAGLEPPCRNPFRSIVVRAVELVFACHEALRLIGEYEPPEGPALPVEPREGVGHGASEAPRGLLYHRYAIDAGGAVREARIVPPTPRTRRSWRTTCGSWSPRASISRPKS